MQAINARTLVVSASNSGFKGEGVNNFFAEAVQAVVGGDLAGKDKATVSSAVNNLQPKQALREQVSAQNMDMVSLPSVPGMGGSDKGR